MPGKLAAIGVRVFAGFGFFRKKQTQPAFAAQQGAVQIRDAGPQAMRDAPGGRWTRVDEQVDESFPASDPPANY
ncbi:MAG: hypothetical protein WC692_02880 [Erythrobacter sp.]|jgi:hypothetical protein